MSKHIYLSTMMGLCLVILSQGVIMPSHATDGFSTEQMQEDEQPQYLYKVLSLQDWNASQFQHSIVLSKEDQHFIHLSKEDQLDGIINKYWLNVPDYVVLKVETKQLPGRLIYETNPGGTKKYYHLYDGSIPLKAIVDVEAVHN